MAIIGMEYKSDGMTFGELFEFVDLARRCGKAPTDKVTLVFAENSDDEILDRFEFSGTYGAGTVPVNMTGTDVSLFCATLDAIIASEGDARGALGTLAELRDRIAGLDLSGDS